jgi:tetratricopeptide (TPR) repeat protein
MSAHRRTVAVGSILSVLGAAVLAPAAFAQQSLAGDARADVQRANALLDSAAYKRAESLYVAVYPRIAAGDVGLRATALFGRAFAGQQRIVGGDTLVDPTPVDTVVAAYLAARDLNAALGASTENNIALMYQALGRYAEATGHFTVAARLSQGRSRAAFFVSAAQLQEAAGVTAGAARLYSEAFRTDSSVTDAARGLLRTLIAAGRPESAMRVASRLCRDSLNAAAVIEALPQLLQSETHAPSDTDAALAIVCIATALPVAGVGPPAFAAGIGRDLGDVAGRRPDLADPIRALADAYRRRAGDDLYREAGSAEWWHSGSYDQRRAWSSALRWIGDWHNKQGATRVARSFYEAAIGYGAGQLIEPWVDRSALVPLAMIYARDDDNGSREMQQRVREFAEILFSAKGVAYEKGDVEQIREYHAALGAYYASKGVWTSNDARNAEFQLTRMREVTDRLKQSGKNVSDPPELLAKLAEHYQVTNRPALAANLKQEVQVRQVRRQQSIARDSITIRPKVTSTYTPAPGALSPKAMVPAAPAVDPRTMVPSAPAADPRTIVPSAPAVDPRATVAAPVTSSAVSRAAAMVAVATIGGTVVDSLSGTGIQGATLVVVGNETQSVVSGEGGQFTLPANGATSLKVRVSANGYLEKEVDLSPGEGARVELRRARPRRPVRKP